MEIQLRCRPCRSRCWPVTADQGATRTARKEMGIWLHAEESLLGSFDGRKFRAAGRRLLCDLFVVY